MNKKLVWGLLLVATSVFAADTGTESGTSDNRAAACKRAKDYAVTSATAASYGSSKKNVRIGECDCSQTKTGYECIVTWTLN